MIFVDTSAWIEYFKDGVPSVVEKVDRYLVRDSVGIGDLIYCEVMKGIQSVSEREEVSSLLLSLPQFEMLGFRVAEKAAANNRLLRSRGVTVNKTVDVIIGTFCAERDIPLLHHDSDFTHMARHIGLSVV